MSRPAASASASASVRCAVCCRLVPSTSLQSHSQQCFDDMAAEYIAALPTVKSDDVRVHTRLVVAASKRTAPASLVSAPTPPPLWQRRHADSGRERETLVRRAAHLLEVADADSDESDGEVATVSVRLADDTLAALLLQRKGGGHADPLRSLCRRMRALLDLPSHGSDAMQTKLHLVAALQLTIFALEAGADSSPSGPPVRLTLQLPEMPGLGTHAWLFRFAEAYFLHMLENGAPGARGAGQLTRPCRPVVGWLAG